MGNMEGAPLPRTSKGKMNFQGMGCRRFCRRVCLSIGVPLGNLGRRSTYRELIVEGRLQKWSISLYGSSLRGGVKQGSGNGHLFPWGPCWET